jgi:hypothetical protein
MNQHHHITQDGKLDHGTISMKLQLFNFSHGTNKQVNILQKQKMTIHHHKPIGGQVDQLGTNIPHQLQSGLITMNQQLNHSTHGMNALKHTLPGQLKSLEEDHGTGHQYKNIHIHMNKHQLPGPGLHPSQL